MTGHVPPSGGLEIALRVIAPSRKKLRPGDVFAMQLLDERYVFGRVVRTADVPRPTPNANLIHIYRGFSTTLAFSSDELHVDNLLVAPLFTNRLGWSRGYFHTVGNRPVGPQDRLDRHTFCCDGLGRHVDLDGEPAPRTDLCGVCGLWSYVAVSDRVCEALGIPLPPRPT